MERETKILWAVVAGVALAAVLLTLGGRVQRELAPEPRAAWLAIAAAGDPVAVSGPLDLAAGEPFTLYAVLEAEDWRGDRIYYTEAEALRLDGETIPAASLRRWTGGQEVRVLWFSVEGGPPFLEVATAADLDRLQLREAFRAEWPQAWAVPGSVEPSRRRLVAGVPAAVTDFGTQRYHVRIEFFSPGKTVVPRLRLRSGGAADLRLDSAGFATVTARLPGPLAAASAVFGLPQVELAEGADAALAGRVAELRQDRLAFGRLPLLRQILDRAGRSWDGLGWRGVDLQDGPEWGAGGVAPGDLLRVGERWVVLVEDRGRTGRLDDQDLGFDFDKGPALLRLGQIFTGDGLVEWAPLGGGAG